ncbi:hypothetical protein SAMN03159496_01267 [Rhizobium sp. NFR07]|uniref:hypothetical protein n=1 Tax=Rhizobium sp. NFR07 TaxID=1566262 RepID=UPI0008E26167|nr:hypothetical protein [Rhizobium sp. NFR07]SFA97359.1 hypothetical protein SAMN03159496_01267 [Rhizobium sp. NFR07]
MPSLHELKHSLGGIWLLVKGDARGLSAFDISDRGVARSFWAFFWCLPALLFLWLDQRHEHLAAFPDSQETTASFIAKSLVAGIADWLLPLAGVFVALALLRKRALFRTLVVICNWGSVAAVYIGAAVLLAIIFAPDATGDRWWVVSAYSLYALLVLYIAFLFIATWRILRIVVGGNPLGRLTIIVAMSLAWALLEPIEKQLGIYVP